MRFIAEFYLPTTKGVIPEVIEAEDIKSAIEIAESKETENKILFYVNERGM